LPEECCYQKPRGAHGRDLSHGGRGSASRPADAPKK
jgi:hypothetical protein